MTTLERLARLRADAGLLRGVRGRDVQRWCDYAAAALGRGGLPEAYIVELLAQFEAEVDALPDIAAWRALRQPGKEPAS